MEFLLVIVAIAIITYFVTYKDPDIVREVTSMPKVVETSNKSFMVLYNDKRVIYDNDKIIDTETEEPFDETIRTVTLRVANNVPYEFRLNFPYSKINVWTDESYKPKELLFTNVNLYHPGNQFKVLKPLTKIELQLS